MLSGSIIRVELFTIRRKRSEWDRVERMYRHKLIQSKIDAARKLRIQKHKRLASRLTLRSASVTLIALAMSLASFSVWTHYANAITPPTVLGELPYQTTVSQTLTDRSGLLVNVANGNVILKTQDLTVASAGPSLSVTRYFNGQATGAGQTGHHGTLSVGPDVSITAGAGGSATYQGPSGFKVTFPSNGSGGYTSPAEFTAGKLENVSGGGWKLTYNQSGQVYTFNASGKLTKEANTAGLAINYAYNTNGTLASATDSQGKVTTFSNYSGTKVGTITDPAGRTVQYTYDSSGKLSDVTDTNGKTWHFEYWDGTNVTWIVDPRNNSTTLSYDGSGRVTTINYNDYTANKTTWTYSYDNPNAKTVVTDPLGHASTYTYDASGRITNTKNAVGDNKGATWDASNNRTTTSDAFNRANTSTYDALNNLTSVQKPTAAGGVAGAKEQYDYTNTTLPYKPSKKTDAAGNTVSYSYNAYGSVASTASASSGGIAMGTITNKYQGDPNGSGGTISCGAKAGQICTSTDARGNVTTFAYDSLGNVITVTPPGPLGAKTYTYDSLSRIKTYTDGNGSKVTMTYDNADRPTNMTYATGGSVIGYTYDNAGNLTQRTDATGTTNWTYDGYNRITKIQQTGKPDLNYTYDAAGNLKTEQGPFGTVTYSYDDANQVTRINQPNGANQDFAYTDGKITTAWLPGNIVQTMSYDQAGRQTSVKAVKNGITTLTDYTGTYMNAAGTKDTEYLQKEINNINTGTYTYSYDGMGRLTDVAGSNGASSFTYSYDAAGNRTQKSKNGVYSGIYGFNAANQLVTDGGAPSGTYDNAGNQTSNGAGLSMFYNAKNQTSSFQQPGQPAINATYADSGQEGRSQFGSMSQLNGLLGLYSDTTGTTSTYYTRLPAGSNPITAQTIGSSYYYYLTDLRGSTVKMTDASGNVVNTYDYEPYGQQISSTGTTPNAIRYANGYFDTSTNLYKYGARYYNPSDARWTQLDPSGQDFGYLYANDNPVNFVDPSGLALTQPYLVNASGSYQNPSAGTGTGPGILGGACDATAFVASTSTGYAAGKLLTAYKITKYATPVGIGIAATEYVFTNTYCESLK